MVEEPDLLALSHEQFEAELDRRITRSADAMRQLVALWAAPASRQPGPHTAALAELEHADEALRQAWAAKSTRLARETARRT